MTIYLGDVVPNFDAQTSIGPLNFYEYLGDSWAVFFSHPADFTPVCTTELGFTANLADEFAKRNVKAIALSVDSVESHQKWIFDINETQNTTVNFPIVADEDRTIANIYGMLAPNSPNTFAGKLTVRSVFIIDPSKKLRLTFTYPASCGRNFHEVLRVIDSLQLTDNHSCATPANWEKGQDVVISPSVSNEDATVKFPKGFNAVKPYLRYTPDPTL